MLSILIPVYNCFVTNLISELHDQLKHSDITFEIICLDDFSDKIYVDQNKNITNFDNTFYLLSKENKGREITRQLLSEKASYHKLLFLDADTMPCHSDFIKNYTEYLNNDYQAVFGGLAYEDKKPQQDHLLRWTYGRLRECQKASKRNENPYTSITSPNFLIDKEVFQSLNSKINNKDYGYDLYFATLMRKASVKLMHIDNEVFHLGIEKSAAYVAKSEEALKTYLQLYNQKLITTKDNKLLSTFVFLKTVGLNHMFSLFFKVAKNSMTKNLLGKNPSIKVFQLYRLSYMCNIDLK